MTKEKVYLGDGVYAEIDTLGDLVLTAPNGPDDMEVIYLDSEVLAALLKYLGAGEKEEVK